MADHDQQASPTVMNVNHQQRSQLSEWVAGCIQSQASYYRTSDLSVAGTLWWYSAAHSLMSAVLPQVSMIRAGQQANSLDLWSLNWRISSDGFSQRITLGPMVGAENWLSSVVGTTHLLQETVADLTLRRIAPIRALTSDALAGAAQGPQHRAHALWLAQQCPTVLLPPRWAPVKGSQRGHQVHRWTCCFLDRVCREDRCSTCPHQRS